jgi:hypothetical protein
MGLRKPNKVAPAPSDLEKGEVTFSSAALRLTFSVFLVCPDQAGCQGIEREQNCLTTQNSPCPCFTKAYAAFALAVPQLTLTCWFAAEMKYESKEGHTRPQIVYASDKGNTMMKGRRASHLLWLQEAEVHTRPALNTCS